MVQEDKRLTYDEFLTGVSITAGEVELLKKEVKVLGDWCDRLVAMHNDLVETHNTLATRYEELIDVIDGLVKANKDTAGSRILKSSEHKSLT